MNAVLSIAGSDSSGGAGIQADIKTIAAHGLFAETAITALTAQNTLGVRSVMEATPRIVADQIDAVFEDIPPAAVKVGMVSSAEIIEVIAERLSAHRARNVVVDPVMVATSGSRLIDEGAVSALADALVPLADIMTPNMPEAEVLAGFPVVDDGSILRAANAIVERAAAKGGATAVLVKGGHGTAPIDDALSCRTARIDGSAPPGSTPPTRTARAARSPPPSPRASPRARRSRRRSPTPRSTCAARCRRVSTWEGAPVRSTTCGCTADPASVLAPARVALLPCCVPDVPRASCPRRIPYCISAVSCRTAPTSRLDSHRVASLTRGTAVCLCRVLPFAAMLWRRRLQPRHLNPCRVSRPVPHRIFAALSRRGFPRFRLRFSPPILFSQTFFKKVGKRG